MARHMTRATLRAAALLALLGLPCASPRTALARSLPQQDAPASRPAAPEDDDALRDRVLRLLAETPLIDGHNDVPWQYRRRVNLQLDRIDFRDTTRLDAPMHTDLARLRAGRIGGQFWSVYVPINATGGGPRDFQTTLEQIDFVKRLVARYPDDLELAYTADDVVRIHKAGKIASMMGAEGGHSIGDSLAALRQLYAAGARYMSLTHSRSTRWADSANDEPRHGGLTRFGREVVREMNRLGMLVDLAHVSPETMHDALDVTEAPVIFSHSSALAVTDNPRNVPDDVLKRVRENGGVVMVTFLPFYVSDAADDWNEQLRTRERELRAQLGLPDPRAAGAATTQPGAAADDKKETTLRAAMDEWRRANPPPWPTIADVADHVDHVRKVAGIDHIGIGSDFDGMPPGPVGLEDVSKYPDLFVELLRRGYSDEDVKKIAGANVLRVMRQAEQTAARLQRARPPSDALIEHLDAAGELLR